MKNLQQSYLFYVLLITLTLHTLGGEVAPAYGKKGVWYKAHLTWYQSYPDENSEECIAYSGCDYAGLFAFVDYQQSKKWVEKNNIVAVHSDHGKWLGREDLQLRTDLEDSSSEIIGTVYDVCSDSDCSGCCSRNAGETGYLIDLEINTLRRMGYTKDDYPYYIYFKIYETEKQRAKREKKELKKEERRLKKESRKKEREEK